MTLKRRQSSTRYWTGQKWVTPGNDVEA
jgi:hypothetical protein